MNCLRELRKFKKKSVIAKIRILILLAAMLIGSSYAWFVSKTSNRITGIRQKVVTWDVEYSVDDEEIQEKYVTVEIDEFFPGMEELEKKIVVRNLSETKSFVTYQIVSIKLFGEEILEELEASGNITAAGTTQNLFSVKKDYPFNAGYYYDKDSLDGLYVDDISTPDAYATCTFFVNWDYERTGDGMSIEENDILDTKFGKKAYDYYQKGNDSALEISMKIATAREGWVLPE